LNIIYLQYQSSVSRPNTSSFTRQDVRDTSSPLAGFSSGSC
jgi:hypothetical protein